MAFGLPILSGIMWLKQNTNQESVSTASESEDEDSFDDEPNDDYLPCVEQGVDASKETKKQVKKPLYALILTPTRELAIQVKNHLTNVAKYTGTTQEGFSGQLCNFFFVI